MHLNNCKSTEQKLSQEIFVAAFAVLLMGQEAMYNVLVKYDISIYRGGKVYGIFRR